MTMATEQTLLIIQLLVVSRVILKGDAMNITRLKDTGIIAVEDSTR